MSENSCSTDATPNRRKWNAFLKSYPDPWPENSPAEPTKPKRPSTVRVFLSYTFFKRFIKYFIAYDRHNGETNISTKR